MLATLCAVGSALADSPAPERTELFLQVSASNSEDLVSLREKIAVTDPERALWIKRSRPVLINWRFLEDKLGSMQDQDVQVSLFEDVVCQPITRLLRKSSFNEHWTWTGSCLGSGFAGTLTIDPVRHKMIGRLSRRTSDGKVEMIEIGRIDSDYGAVYELDVDQLPPPMPMTDDTPRLE